MKVLDQLRALFGVIGGDKKDELRRLEEVRLRAIKLRDGDRYYLAEYLRREVIRIALELSQYRGDDLLRVVGKMEAFARFAEYLDNLEDVISELTEEILTLSKQTRGGV